MCFHLSGGRVMFLPPLVRQSVTQKLSNGFPLNLFGGLEHEREGSGTSVQHNNRQPWIWWSLTCWLCPEVSTSFSFSILLILHFADSSLPTPPSDSPLLPLPQLSLALPLSCRSPSSPPPPSLFLLPISLWDAGRRRSCPT